MNRYSRELIISLINSLKLTGSVLEIGPQKIQSSSYEIFNNDSFKYSNLNIDNNDIPNTIIADICSNTAIKSQSFDIILAVDVFEHLKEPWKAAKEIKRLLKPGGVVIIITVWSWRYHPVPIDYWRFSDDCLEFLFDGLTCLDKGFDGSERRKNIIGFSTDGSDNAPIDELKGWRENWRVFFVRRKSLFKSKEKIPLEKPFYRDMSKYIKRYQKEDNLINSYNYKKDWLIKGINFLVQKEKINNEDQTFIKIEENKTSNINFIEYRFKEIKDFIYTTTVVAKKDSKFRLLISYMNHDAWDGGSNAAVVFDLEAGMASPNRSNPILYEIKPLKKDWYLCTLSAKCLKDNLSGLCFVLFDCSFLNKREPGSGLFISNPRLTKSFKNEYII